MTDNIEIRMTNDIKKPLDDKMLDWHDEWQSPDGKDIAVRFGKKVRLHEF